MSDKIAKRALKFFYKEEGGGAFDPKTKRTQFLVNFSFFPFGWKFTTADVSQ